MKYRAESGKKTVARTNLTKDRIKNRYHKMLGEGTKPTKFCIMKK